MGYQKKFFHHNDCQTLDQAAQWMSHDACSCLKDLWMWHLSSPLNHVSGSARFTVGLHDLKGLF